MMGYQTHAPFIGYGAIASPVWLSVPTDKDSRRFEPRASGASHGEKIAAAIGSRASCISCCQNCSRGFQIIISDMIEMESIYLYVMVVGENHMDTPFVAAMCAVLTCDADKGNVVCLEPGLPRPARTRRPFRTPRC